MYNESRVIPVSSSVLPVRDELVDACVFIGSGGGNRVWTVYSRSVLLLGNSR